MKIIGVIPARFGATRFPGKPLVEIAGKPLLQWVIEGAQRSTRLADVVVATDHAGIAELAGRCGCEAIMTSPELPSGTDRAWAATRDRAVDGIVNIQGDEPLMTGAVVDQLAAALTAPAGPEMATLAQPLAEEELDSPHAVKVLVNHRGDAIYFSRFPIPYSRHDAKSLGGGIAPMKHIGLYAYTKNFLEKFCSEPPALIERGEGLEQLRALHLGARIRVIRVAEGLHGVDTPEDVGRVEPLLRARNFDRSDKE